MPRNLIPQRKTSLPATNSNFKSCTNSKHETVLDVANAKTKEKSKDRDKVLRKDKSIGDREITENEKNTATFNQLRNMEKNITDIDNSELEDKTPTNEISISSINEMTDNSLLKDSFEGSAKWLDPEDIKMDMMESEQEKELSSTKDEKDVDQSERDNSTNTPWLSKSVDRDAGIYIDWIFYILFVIG